MTNTDAAGQWSDGAGASDNSAASPREMASSAAQTVKQEAQSFAAQARDKAADQIDQHKETATRTLGDFANAIRKAGDELSQSDQSMASRLVQQAADGLEGLSRSMSEKRPEELLDSVREFGRRNPTAFVAGSVLVGLALGRFLKSSGEPRETSVPATFSSADGGALDIDALNARAATASPTDAGATAVGVPASEMAAGEMGVEGLTGELAGDDRGALDGDDRDRARFGETGA